MAQRLRVMLQHQSPQGGQKSHRQPPAAASVGHARAVLVGGVQITTTICAVVLPGLHRAVAGGVIHVVDMRNRLCPRCPQSITALCAGIYIHFGFPAGRVADILVGNRMPCKLVCMAASLGLRRLIPISGESRESKRHAKDKGKEQRKQFSYENSSVNSFMFVQITFRSGGNPLTAAKGGSPGTIAVLRLHGND